MEQTARLGCRWQIWNLAWVIWLGISFVSALYAFRLSDESIYLKLFSFFSTISAATATLYQVYKHKPDGFLSNLKHEFFVIRKFVSGSAIWQVNQVEEITQKQTEELKSTIVNSQIEIKKEIASALNLKEDIDSVKEDELEEVDIAALRTLWQFLRYEAVYGFLQGCANERVYLLDIDKFECFLNSRKNPKFQLYDDNLEQMLRDFEVAMSTILDRIVTLFGPPTYNPSNFLVPIYRDIRHDTPYYQESHKEFEEFINEEVIPTYRKYENLTKELKKRRIYHKLTT